MMFQNKTKTKLKTDETVYGCFVRYPDAGLIELLGYLGWDFLIFDGEHGPIQPHDCEHMVRAAELSGVTPIVRVTSNQAPVILRFMDTGAQGAQVPNVNSAVEAKAAVQSVKYHPQGTRGLAGTRAAGYGQTIPLTEYVQQANEETLVIIHIETAEAVEQHAEIVNVEGVDVVFVGPTDLSQSLGYPGQLQHPTVQAAIERVIVAVAGARPVLGIFAGNPEAANKWRDRGARYIATSLEAVLRPAVQNFLEVVHSDK